MAKKNYNAFSIIELLVAIALLVILAGLSSIVFSTTVKAHRKATASIEVARNLRVLSNQLTADLRGLRKDAPVMLRFSASGTDKDGSGTIEPDEYVYYDMLHFFADGDFQTTRQYDDGSAAPKTIIGNIARLYYGHANSELASPDFDTYQTLARKAHILTADAGIYTVYGEIPLVSNWPTIPNVPDYTAFVDPADGFGMSDRAYPGTYFDENALEFNTITLTQWLTALNYLDGGNPDNTDAFITGCMTDSSRPFIDLSAMETLHLLMAQGVIDFRVQWAYTVEDLTTDATAYVPIPAPPVVSPDYFTGVRWWPSLDPDGDGMTTDSDFTTMGNNTFGVYLALPNIEKVPGWSRVKPLASESSSEKDDRRCETQVGYFRQDFYPKAFKFTFTLRDLNGIFEEGKTFTHIVYLD